MPSKSAKQRRFMAAASHNPQFAKKAGIPQKVAQDFNQADMMQGGQPQATSGQPQPANTRMNVLKTLMGGNT